MVVWLHFVAGYYMQANLLCIIITFIIGHDLNYYLSLVGLFYDPKFNVFYGIGEW